MRFVITVLTLISFFPHNVFAKDFIFDLPVDCTPNIDCWIVNYVDMGTKEGAVKDPACKARTYDGHKGTDFGVRDLKAMEEGVDVLAAANGTILRLRDGQDDAPKDKAALEAVKENGTECGNGILIDHGDGYQTMYCHLKKDSIIVKQDERVVAGQKIAQIGHSGLTEFPHLHFGINFENEILDPFTGQAATRGCGQQGGTLWSDDSNLKYEAAALYAYGFHSGVPNLTAVNNGDYQRKTLPRSSEALTFWFVMFGAQEGDKITMQITDPDGQVFAQRGLTQEKTRARQFYFAGRKATNNPLKTGTYIGEATVTRPGIDGGAPLEYSIQGTIRVTE